MCRSLLKPDGQSLHSGSGVGWPYVVQWVWWEVTLANLSRPDPAPLRVSPASECPGANQAWEMRPHCGLPVFFLPLMHFGPCGQTIHGAYRCFGDQIGDANNRMAGGNGMQARQVRSRPVVDPSLHHHYRTVLHRTSS